MNSIYDKASNEAIISRINKLTPNTKAEWGKMTVDQMLKHCTAAIEIAYGEKEIKVNLMMKILGKLVKIKFSIVTFNTIVLLHKSLFLLTLMNLKLQRIF